MTTQNRDNNFPAGFIWKKPADNAPDFVKGKISIKVSEFKNWLDENVNNDWVNLDVLKSKEGKIYAKKNDWKPEKKDDDVISAENLPF
jgi:hypothetical protein